jgi:hypothetical protein
MFFRNCKKEVQCREFVFYCVVNSMLIMNSFTESNNEIFHRIYEPVSMHRSNDIDRQSSNANYQLLDE